MAKKNVPGQNRKRWVNKIVGHADIDPTQLLAHSSNWRIHPEFQQRVLEAGIDEVGYIRSVTVNKRTSELWPEGDRNVETVIDGHLRVAMAISSGQPTIPVEFVDLTPDEEWEALVTLDPVAELAEASRENLLNVIQNVHTSSAEIEEMLADLAKTALGNIEEIDKSGGEPPEQEWGIIVMCDSKRDQDDLMSRLKSDGYDCKSLS